MSDLLGDPNYVKALVRGDTKDWGVAWTATDERYMRPAPADAVVKSRCRCCGIISTHLGLCNGVLVIHGCEWAMRMWVRRGRMPQLEPAA
jgi:hypothetical protein